MFLYILAKPLFFVVTGNKNKPYRIFHEKTLSLKFLTCDEIKKRDGNKKTLIQKPIDEFLYKK